jgi:hypothetical protein
MGVARGIVDLDQFRDASGDVTREHLMELAKQTPPEGDPPRPDAG